MAGILTVRDQNGEPVANAAVTVHWRGILSDYEEKDYRTSTAGKAIIRPPPSWIRIGGADARIVVTKHGNRASTTANSNAFGAVSDSNVVLQRDVVGTSKGFLSYFVGGASDLLTKSLVGIVALAIVVTIAFVGLKK